ncbi:MAG: tetraacyldisaccharide 4'-kinase [Candidatus Brocadiia bacterium]
MRDALFRLHRRVINPARRGAGLTCVRAALLAASWPYGLAVRARNALYSRGWRRAYDPPVPVVSVGNITAGGTGKTPMVAWLARLMLIRNRRPAILSRGYGRHERLSVDDENDLLSHLAQGVPVVVNPDRAEGAREAVRRHGADALILDDGFQHRGISRELDIVLIDALWPFGGGCLLPRGLLREPLSGLSRADVLVITRSDLVSPERVERISERLKELCPGAPVALCRNALEGLRPIPVPGTRQPADSLREGNWGWFCGVGNPEAFDLTLRQAGCAPVFGRVFSDHTDYGAAKVNELMRAAEEAGCDALVTTEKDAVKLEAAMAGEPPVPLFALQVTMELAEPSPALTRAIMNALGKSP